LTQLYGDHQQFTIENQSAGGAKVTVCVPLHTSVTSARVTE
jgi:hypothetical protein